MNREDIIRMAREAGFDVAPDEWHWLERFAALVAAAVCEKCAKVVEESSLPDAYSEACLPEIAAAIRARGQI
jgi:hypothetical protein